jgi:acetolactate synthase regulatory subunit
MCVENAAPAQLDLAVREAGWHFMWIESACSRLGWGRTNEVAANRAIARALAQTEARFNAAELGVLRVWRYLGFRICKATLHARHIQQRASLGLIDELSIRQLAPE